MYAKNRVPKRSNLESRGDKMQTRLRPSSKPKPVSFLGFWWQNGTSWKIKQQKLLWFESLLQHSCWNGIAIGTVWKCGPLPRGLGHEGPAQEWIRADSWGGGSSPRSRLLTKAKLAWFPFCLVQAPLPFHHIPKQQDACTYAALGSWTFQPPEPWTKWAAVASNFPELW